MVALMVAVLLTSCSLYPTGGKSVMPTVLAASNDTVTISKEEYERLQKYASLDELAQMIEAYYYIAPDYDAMLEGAKRGLLAGLNDPYTYYYSPEEFSKMWEDDGGEYAGIGIQISASYVTMLCTITRVFSGSPAEAAGLRKGDILAKVDDLDVTALTLNDAVNIMRGEVGKPVDVTVLRGEELVDFTVNRQVVHVNWVSSTMLDSDVGYIQLYDFSGDCYQSFATQLQALVKQNAKALVIDLRDNPGGWVDDAVKIADLFLPKETVTYFEYNDGTREYYDATDGALSIPMVLLMNQYSASASEILAGAFQDYGIATVVGTQSYGKGIVQFVLPLSTEGAGVQITAAKWFTPSGNNVHKIGITPDVTAELPKGDTTLYELGDLADAQLKTAYNIAVQKIAGTFVEPPAPTPTEEPAEDPAAAADSDTGDDAAAGAAENFYAAVS